MLTLKVFWTLFAAAFSSLVKCNTESRLDFLAINNALNIETARLTADNKSLRDRQDRMQKQIDDVLEELRQVRDERAELRTELNECNRRHDADEQQIREMTDRLNALEGMGS